MWTPRTWVDVDPNLMLDPPTSTVITAVTSGNDSVEPSGGLTDEPEWW